MDIGFHQVPDRPVHEPVALKRRQAPKRLGDNAHPEMAQAPGGAGMPQVMAAFILDDELLGGKTARQDYLKARCPLSAVQGSTGRNGSTSTRSNTPALT
jgi:hypothetical protein